MDLSVLFEIVPGGQVKHRGYTRFFTTSGGQYRGTLLAPFQDSISDELRAFLLREEEGVRWFHEMTQHLLDKLAVYLRKDAFVGKAGIDMMLVRTRDGAIRLRAPLELNPRATMGHVSQTIRRRVANEARGVFLFVGEKELSLSSCQDFPGFVDKMENALAYRVGNDGRSMAQGVMPLTDPQCASKVMAICLAAESVAHLDHVLTQAGLPALG